MGAQAVRLLDDRGGHICAPDDLWRSYADQVPNVPRIEIDLRSDSSDRILAQAMADHGTEAVTHFV
jgi:UDP-glucose 4-epimerase